MRFVSATSPAPSGAWLLRSIGPEARLLFVPPGGSSMRPVEIFNEERELLNRVLASRKPLRPPVARPARVEPGNKEDLRVVACSGQAAARVRVIADPSGLDLDSLRQLFGGELGVLPHFLLTGSALLSADACGAPLALSPVVLNHGAGFLDEVLEYLGTEYAESWVTGHALRLLTPP
jgi:hypothetical protein